MKRTIPNNRTRMSILPIGLLAAAFCLSWVAHGTAQTGASLYSGSSTATSVDYGSLGYGSTQSSLALNFQSTGTSSPASISNVPLVAQTPVPVPANITPVSPTAPVYSPTTPSTISPLPLQAMDPYGTPNQSSLFPVAGTPVGTSSVSGYSNSPSNVYSGNFDRFVPETYEAMRRFREATSVEFTYLPGGNDFDSFGLTELDLRMQLAIPCRFIPNNGTGRSGPGYFYIAPGGNLVWWDGPVGPPDVSPNGFGAFLDFGLQPQFNDVFAMDAWFRFGVFSDFKKVRSDALRFQGRLMGLFTVSPQVKIVAGLIYLDRERVKMLPTGGVVWTPNDDWILRLTFPNPKISRRLWNGGRAEWWGYATADYGGGSWDISGLGKTDYNDIRVGVGLEFETVGRVNGYFEFGGSFNRELYSHGEKWCSPPSVVYLKTGFIF